MKQKLMERIGEIIHYVLSFSISAFVIGIIIDAIRNYPYIKDIGVPVIIILFCTSTVYTIKLIKLIVTLLQEEE